MGAGTSPVDGVLPDGTGPGGAHADGPPEPAGATVSPGPEGSVEPGKSGKAPARGKAEESGDAPEPEEASGTGEPREADTAENSGAVEATASPDRTSPDRTTAESATAPGAGGGSTVASRRFSLTHDTARPEGGGRAASGGAPAPARQWPLLTVLCAAGAGLLIVAIEPFADAFRIGAILIGAALLAGGVLRWLVPSVGMLAVRSRFTDLVTYGLMGALIVLLALMAQPKPWLYVPFLQDLVHFTIR
ncbi:DUF3017 domain-containing protein [Streptomyces sp. NBC_01754]|uniref:DUF3017 domain-containing protein n=1 Tax=Streptomyces sp. NBC_01754 TaxID=2975930 RepID=UPI002DDBD022|nr:DUF3017 domain-containing protein [Streptomyces sp. NBC_01754]WSC94413.1 DUF3017 domain-containing protein [Streptomyces sp. NBC_01754]